jgi:hypothetical protein
MTMLVKLKILLTYFADLLFCYQMASNVGFSKYQLVMASVMSVSENIYIYIGQQSWSVKSAQLEIFFPLTPQKN